MAVTRTAEIDTLFARLYGPDSAALASLHAAIEQAARDRPAWLRARDKACGADPIWHLRQDRIGYSAYVDRFAGTLDGVAARAPYLRELGVTYLHLLPFWLARAGESDGGFAVADYEQVDPRLGDDAALDRLAAALDSSGITLCADFVLNHSADSHPWAVAARAGDPRARAFYHIFDSRTLPDEYEASLPQVFPETAPGNFTHVPEAGGWVWTTFYPYQWDLNWTNPAVFVAMAGTMLRLANRGIGAFRLDSAPFLWKRPGTRCQGLPEVHLILRLLRLVVEAAAPSLLLKAEAVVPAAELPAYFGIPEAPGRECHIAYQTSLMVAGWAAVAEERADFLRQVLQDTAQPGVAGGWLTYVRCHDDVGWGVLRAEAARLGDAGGARLANAAARLAGANPADFPRGRAFQGAGHIATAGMAASLAGIEAALQSSDAAALDLAIRRCLLLHAIMFCAGGMPVIYMGDELGQTNTAENPDGDGRWLHRPLFDEAAAALRHDPSQVAGRLFSMLRDMAAARRGLPALAGDVPLTLPRVGNPGLLALQRGTTFLGVFNTTSTTLDVSGEIQSFLRQSGNMESRIVMGTSAGDRLLQPWSFLWLSSETSIGR